MILGENHLAQHHIFRVKNTEINQIYKVMSIRSFITALISIFIPIYLLRLGFSLQSVILFYLQMFFGEALLEYPSALSLAKLGPKHNIAFSLPFLILHFWLLWTIPQFHWNIIWIALTGSITLSFFWQGYHYDFSVAKTKKKAGKEISRMYLIMAVLGAVAPFLGGVIATKFGFNGLFGLVTALMAFAILPLFKSEDKRLNRKFDLKKLKFSKMLGREVAAYAGSGFEGSTGVNLWPILGFLILGSYEKVGLATSLGLLLTIVVTYWVGKRSDAVNKCKYIRVGSFLTGTIYIVKAFVENIGQVIGLNILTSVTHSIYLSPFVAEYYLHADEESRNEYIFLMETAVDIARIIFFGIIYLLGFILSGKDLIVAGMFIGGFGTFLVALMPQAKCEVKKIKVISKIQKARV